MEPPDLILADALRRAEAHTLRSLIHDDELREDVEYVAKVIRNRAGARLLLACLLAKAHRPELDVRKPYTEIGDQDAFSGRTYDERHVGPFVIEHDLPCNTTTAFLTPALRNRNTTLTTDTQIVGRPPRVYQSVLQLLDAVHTQRVSVHDLLAESVRWLVLVRDEQRERMSKLIEELNTTAGALPLSTEGIVALIKQHMESKGTSRLPVLIVAAAYLSAQVHLGESVRPLQGHNAADHQTGALGDVEITLTGENAVVTSYEMKDRPITQADIDSALRKLAESPSRVDNYLFVTTEAIEDEVRDYAASLYEQTGGVEFAMLDVIDFLRHFLHLFHRLRATFLNTYQELILAEPASAVSQPVKEAFLSLRRAAEVE